MLSNGQIIGGRYEIVKSIGEGGMANVYLANDKILDRKVAIKVLRGDLANDEKFIRRFQREAQSVANLSHPNIVEVYDVEEEEGQHYIVMEYIEGKTLKQLLQKRGSLTLSEVIDIMLQLTDGLAHAHDAYIIHRDIKPQNIMIQDDGLVKITDFGIAMALNATQLTQTNSVMGSVHYLPPEQANGKSSTIKSDIYSLGILMYELITGSVPFKGDNAVEIALKHLKEKIPSIRRQNPTIPQSVENIVLRATAKNPKNRYDSVKDMNKDLKECLNEDKKNEKKIVFEYPENDIDDTKVITNVKKSKPEIEEPKDLDELKEKKKIEEQNIKFNELVKYMKPLGFNDYNKLQKNAFCVVSDSGTITEESSIMGFPAITIRQAHERPEGMDEGTLIMSGVDSKDIIDSIKVVTSEEQKPHIVNDYDVDHVGAKVVKIIMSYTGYINRTVWRKY